MTIVCTVDFMAPEMIIGTASFYDTAVDVYGLAIVLWEILFPGKSAYDTTLSHLGVYNAVLGGTRPSLENIRGGGVPERCRTLLSRAWAQDPATRPSAAEVAHEARTLWLLHTTTTSLVRKGKVELL